MENIEISQPRFHQDHIRALLNIQGHFAQSFLAIGGVHLVGATITEFGRGLGGLPEWAIKGGSIFGGIGEDRQIIEPAAIQGLPDGRHPPIHHIAGSDDIRSRFGMTQSGSRQELQARVVQNLRAIFAPSNDAAMSMAHVFAEADVSDHNQFRQFGFQQSDRLLNNAAGGVSAAGALILSLRYAKKQDCGNPQRQRSRSFAQKFIRGQLENARHRFDRAADFAALANKQRENELGRVQGGFGDQIPQQF